MAVGDTQHSLLPAQGGRSARGAMAAAADADFVDLTAEDSVDLTSSAEAMVRGTTGMPQAEPSLANYLRALYPEPRAGEGGGQPASNVTSAAAWLPCDGGWRHASTGDEWHGELCEDRPRGKGVYIFADSRLKISGSISGSTYDSLAFSGQGAMDWPGLSKSAIHA
jgi:hypothetical protein